MGLVKAITEPQPRASLVALGIVTILTRSRPTKHRGPLAIHAGARRPTRDDLRIGDFRIRGFGRAIWTLTGPGLPEFRSTPRLEGHVLRFGAVVATCTLVNVVPTAELWWSWTWPDEKPGWRRYVERPGIDHIETIYADENQRPYGDFTPERWAWLLADINSVDPPIPAQGRQGLWEWQS